MGFNTGTYTAGEGDFLHIVSRQPGVACFRGPERIEKIANWMQSGRHFQNSGHTAANFLDLICFGDVSKPELSPVLQYGMIVANEIGLGANPICAALLHDVVEDTDHTLRELRDAFGDDVATLVDTVTKRKADKYETSLQVDNYKQMLQSIHYDIRALLLKLADRLHNMRTLKSMLPHKQLKIASETDYFYAPLAHRLGLYQVKTELENLSFRYRQPHEYDELKGYITRYVEDHAEAAEAWMVPIRETLAKRGIKATVVCEPRSAYSIWAKMKEDSISLSEVTGVSEFIISCVRTRVRRIQESISRSSSS